MEILFFDKGMNLLAATQSNIRPIVGDNILIKDKNYEVKSILWNVKKISEKIFLIVNVQEMTN